MKVYLNSIEKELSFSMKKIIKIHYFYWNIYIIRILKFWLPFSVFLLIYSLEIFCCGVVTEWQDIPLKSWENFLSNGISSQTVRILARFHTKRGIFYWTTGASQVNCSTLLFWWWVLRDTVKFSYEDFYYLPFYYLW